MMCGLPYDNGTGTAQDEIVSSITFADVSASNGDPFTSNTQSVRARFPGAALTVVWHSDKIEVGSVIHLTSLQINNPGNFAEVRIAHDPVTVAGQVRIARSSGATADGKFEATIGPAG